MQESLQAGSVEPTVEVRWPQRDVAQVVLGGEHDLSTTDRLNRTFTEALGSCAKLIVDLRVTLFIDASTIGALVGARRRADEAGRGFSLVLATTPIVERALEITGVLPVLNRVPTLEAALPNSLLPAI